MKNFIKEIYYSLSHYFKTTDMLLFSISLAASIISFPLIHSLYPGSIRSLRPFYMQVAATTVGVFFAIIVSNIDYHKIKKFFKPLAITVIALNMLPFTSLGKIRGDSLLTSAGSGSANLSWVDFGFTRIQPSEFLKIAFILTFAYHCSVVLKNINRPKVFALVMLHAAVPIGIIYVQKDYGTMCVFIFIAICVILTANTNWKIISLMAAMGVIILILFITKKLPYYLLERIQVLFNIDEAKLTAGHQQYTGLLTLATGKIFGKGFNSKDLIYSTPELYNDMIFAHIGQIFGFVGCLCVLIWVIVYCARILQIARDSKDNLGCSICVGAFGLIFFQSIINIGMVLCVCPVIGISLPFISAGGSSVLSTYIVLGVILSVQKHSYKPTLF